MEQIEGIKTADLQAVAFHLYFRCKEQTAAFEQCYASADKPASKCADELKALTSCASNLVADASAKAHDAWHHYTHCLDFMSGRYNYCRPEKAAFEEAFPLES